MSRTWRRDDSGRKNHGDNRRNKKREKSNSHWTMESRKNRNNEDRDSLIRVKDLWVDRDMD